MQQDDVIKYLKLHVPNFQHNQRGNTPMFTCPACGQLSCRFIPSTTKIDCMGCKFQDDIIGIAKLFGHNEGCTTDAEIKDKMNLMINPVTPDFKPELFDFYFANNWDLVPLSPNSKMPCEKDWPNKEHKRPIEWNDWLTTNLNIGVKCGSKSGITVVDVDQAEVPAEIDLLKGNPLVQKTPRGWHFFYKYVPELPTTRVEALKTDILNNGKQCVIYPSVTDGTTRNFTAPLVLPEMPEDLKKYLISKVGSRPSDVDKNGLPTLDENFKIKLEDLTLKNNNLEGCCNTTFLQLGGVLRKQLSTQDTSFVLKLLNRHLLEKPMPPLAIDAMTKSLERYTHFEEHTLLADILKYLKIVEFANSKEIKDALVKYKKDDIDKALAHLTKEQEIIKKGRNFHSIQKANWKETLSMSQNALDFKMPYFDSCANIAYGDMILLGSKSKYGKTTVAMNLVKSFVEQGKKPYYISLEAGSRFSKTALNIGLQEGDFKWDFISDPTKITLEENAITILDWLLIEDKAMTDSVMKYFVEQLYKSQGILIAFVQLKDDGTYFAPNMIKQFPALAARYLYTDDGAGIEGEWILDAIRDPKLNMKTGKIPCKFDWDSRRLRTLEEIQSDKNKA